MYMSVHRGFFLAGVGLNPAAEDVPLRCVCCSWCCESGRWQTPPKTRLFHNTRVALLHCRRDPRHAAAREVPAPSARKETLLCSAANNPVKQELMTDESNKWAVKYNMSFYSVTPAVFSPFIRHLIIQIHSIIYILQTSAVNYMMWRQVHVKTIPIY